MANGKRPKPANSARPKDSSKAMAALAKQTTQKRQVPWMAGGAGVVIVGLLGLLAYNLVPAARDHAVLDAWAPTTDNPDPSTKLDGIVKVDYEAGLHIGPTQRVAYTYSPPFGGPHDATWATCTGIVYPDGIRTENAVHSLEHGAVWVTYNPDEVSSADVQKLAARVDGKSFTLMSPYPGLDAPISLQSWGHQLKLQSADDERIDQFITALRLNKNTYPEPGASCSTVPGGGFDPDNPPPFDASAPGPGAIPQDGGGIQQNAEELQDMANGGTGQEARDRAEQGVTTP